MSRLFTLKDWLSLEEASRYLSALIEEPAAEADLLQLGLQGHLTLSVRLVNNGHAKIGKAVPLNEAKRFCIEMPDGLYKNQSTDPDGKVWFVGTEGTQINENTVVEFGKDIVSIYDIWDLTMSGADRIYIENVYQKCTGGPDVELVNLSGPILVSGTLFAQIHERFDKETIKRWKQEDRPWNNCDNWYPADTLPEGSVIVVRPSNLKAFVEANALPPQPPPKSTGRPTAGRPVSQRWPSWVAELVGHIHDNGPPAGTGTAGVDELIGAVADRLAARGMEAPARSTVQETVRAVLRRLRDAGN